MPLHEPFAVKPHNEHSVSNSTQTRSLKTKASSSRSMASEMQKLSSDDNSSSPRHSKSGKESPQPASLVVHRQSSDEDHPMVQGTSTFDYSADTFSRSKATGDLVDSYSDDDDAIYIPFEYKGDGRKREAKKHKM